MIRKSDGQDGYNNTVRPAKACRTLALSPSIAPEHDLCSPLTNLYDIQRKVIRVVVVHDVSELIGPKVGEA